MSLVQIGDSSVFLFFLFLLFFPRFKSERIELISNGNFENKMTNWFTSSGYDKVHPCHTFTFLKEVDFLKPDLVEKSPTPKLWNGERSTEKYSILFNKPHGPYDKRPGLVSSISLTSCLGSRNFFKRISKKKIFINFIFTFY
jgi:hypothetical protein